MELFHKIGKDRIGAVLLVALGAAVAVAGQGYDMGTLAHMDSGYIPVVLGILMMVVGVAIGLTAAPAESPKKDAVAFRPEWRGWGCILGGVVAFVVLGTYGGMVPAAWACVFIAAMGDRQNPVRQSAILATVITVAGVLIFRVGLGLQLPLFTWG
jgi:hypothetical protein